MRAKSPSSASSWRRALRIRDSSSAGRDRYFSVFTSLTMPRASISLSTPSSSSSRPSSRSSHRRRLNGTASMGSPASCARFSHSRAELLLLHTFAKIRTSPAVLACLVSSRWEKSCSPLWRSSLLPFDNRSSRPCCTCSRSLGPRFIILRSSLLGSKNSSAREANNCARGSEYAWSISRALAKCFWFTSNWVLPRSFCLISTSHKFWALASIGDGLNIWLLAVQRKRLKGRIRRSMISATTVRRQAGRRRAPRRRSDGVFIPHRRMLAELRLPTTDLRASMSNKVENRGTPDFFFREPPASDQSAVPDAAL